MIVITGPGRCGTTLVTQFCIKIGLNVAYSGGIIKKINAGLEWGPLTRFCKSALRGDRIINNSVEIKQTDKEIMKSPFLFRKGGMALKELYKIRKDLKILFLFRNEGGLRQSGQKAWPGKWETPIKNWAQNLYRDFFGFLEFIEENEILYRILFFPKFLEKYYLLHNALCDLGIEMPLEAESVWRDIVDFSKVHF
ncbi:hypothetical protein KY312_01570 [Candidatus Woesearchaeota archaeon]|nr:hypothetical protein [Candidatus Woesearchaeota archaeon]